MKKSVFFSLGIHSGVRENVFLRVVLFLFSGFSFVISTAYASSYFEMDLESLMDITITSLSRREEKLRDTAAALYVITSDDIRRSGATRVEEALRMVPGLMVGQNNGWIWSISSRGRSFNPGLENKLLVMVDGQSIYSPVFSGTMWETANLFMEDIDRIEVIRGPGGATWGSNAVNGIINIITKSSSQTTGAMLSGRYGHEEKGAGSFRFGDEISPGNFYRIYSSGKKIKERVVDDELRTKTVGFRTDLSPTSDSSLSLAGDFLAATSEGAIIYPDLERGIYSIVNISEDIDKYKLNGEFSRQLANGTTLSFHAGHIRDQRKSVFLELDVAQSDFDFDCHFSPLENHLVQAGAGYRLSKIKIPEFFEPNVNFLKNKNTDHLFSAFFSDTINFFDGDLSLILGNKFEYMKNIGLELSPNIRMLYKLNDRSSVWASASRTIRTPSYLERFSRYHQVLFRPEGAVSIGRISLVGEEKIKEEDARSIEFGYRFVASADFSLDVSVYYTWYKNLTDASIVFDQAFLSDEIVPHIQVDAKLDNLTEGTVKGGELALAWKAVDWLTLRTWYAYCDDQYEFKGDGENLFGLMYGKISPKHQFFLRSSFNLPYALELDFMFRHITKLSGLDIPTYTSLDARLGYRPTEHIEISLIGKNLWEKSHREASNSIAYGAPRSLDRGVFCSIRVDF